MINWEVYIIQCSSGKLYTGITNDLTKRLDAHQNKRGARFFYIEQAKCVVFREEYPDRSTASKREAQIKQMSRAEKLALIRAGSSANEVL